MRTLTRHRLAKGCLTGAIAGATAFGLVGCDTADDATAPNEGETTTMTEDSGSPDAGKTDGAQESPDDNDAVDVAAIQDEDAGSDGIYDGAYDDDLLNEMNSFDGDRVTVSAKVNEVISEKAFTIGGIENPDVEPLLVIHANPLDFVEEGQLVLVTGVVHMAYETAVAEDQIGMQLEEVQFREFGQEPYIETDTVGELADTT